MFDLRKLFARERRTRGGRDADADANADSDYASSVTQAQGLEVEYRNLISSQFRRWGIRSQCATVEVRQIGRAGDGFDVFVGMVRLSGWDRPSGLRLLLGLPLLESKVRKAVRATWLADYSHFGGLWLHASEQLSTGPGMEELRELLVQLAPPSRPPASQGVTPQGGPAGATTLPPISAANSSVGPVTAPGAAAA